MSHENVKTKKTADYITFAISAAMLALCIALAAVTYINGSVSFEIENLVGMGIRFETNGLNCILAVVASLMWTVTSLFSFDYMSHDKNKCRYYVFNIITLFATVGVFLSKDLFTLFIFFELMSIASYVFVVEEETKEALRAAATYLAVAVIGGLVLLMGLVLFYSETGTLVISQLMNAAAVSDNPGTLMAAAVCMLIGFFAKAGVFPIHIWLPKAHPVAPAPASALLSGILTKAGVYGMIVVSSFIVVIEPEFGYILLVLGVVTMVLGALMALFSVQMKRTLACSSVSQIGFITVGISTMILASEEGGESLYLAMSGTILHMVNHSMFKLSLFLIAGAVYMQTHDLVFDKIRGFGRKKPFLLVTYLLSAMGIGGFPLLSGYVSKTLLHEGLAEYAHEIVGLDMYSLVKFSEYAFLFAGGLTIAYMLKIFTVLFLEKPEQETNTKGDGFSIRTRISLLVPAVLIPVFGVFANSVFMKLPAFAEEKTAELAEEINFFSLNNLKGAAVSIIIGFLVYFLVVRTFMMKKTEDGRHTYINRWPAWLDLEDSVYRPVLLKILPFVFGLIFRICDKLLDGFCVFIQRYVLRPLPKREKPPVGSRFFYAVGMFLDYIKNILNTVIFRRHPIKKSFVNAVEVGKIEANRTLTLIIKSVSFALMMCCGGLLITLIYLMLIV